MRAIIRSAKLVELEAETDADRALLGMWRGMDVFRPAGAPEETASNLVIAFTPTMPAFPIAEPAAEPAPAPGPPDEPEAPEPLAEVCPACGLVAVLAEAEGHVDPVCASCATKEKKAATEAEGGGEGDGLTDDDIPF